MDDEISRDELSRLLRDMNLLVLSYVGRSGSMFFQSLMDSHPQVASFPMTFGGLFQEVFGVYDIESFVKRYHWLFEKSDDNYLHRTNFTVPTLLGDNQDEYVVVRKEGFLSSYQMLIHVLGRDPSSPREMLIVTHLALYHSRGFNIAEVKYILYHLHSLLPDKVAALIDQFPQPKAIFMVRDHKEGWAGWRKTVAFRRNGRVFLDDLENYILITKEEVRRFRVFKSMAPSIKIVDLNELHLRGRELLEEVCQYLGINFHPSILESTFLGLKWWGNASDRKPINGLDKSRGEKKFPKVLSPLEMAVIDDAFSESMVEFNFKPWSPSLTQSQLFWAIWKEYLRQFLDIHFFLPATIYRMGLKKYFDETYYRRLRQIPLIPNQLFVHYGVICLFVSFKYLRGCFSRWADILRGMVVNRSYSPRY